MIELTNEFLDEALDAYALAMFRPRGDEAHAHVKDLGSCDRQTWARRSGYEGPFDPDTLRKFQMGFDIERNTLEALGSVLDLTVGMRVAMTPTFEGIAGHIVDERYIPTDGELLGHPDGVGDDAVVEVKSTEFLTDRATFERIVPDLVSVDERQRHYLLQCAAYALALRKRKGVLVIVCRASGKKTSITFDPHAYEAEVIARMLDVLTDTGPRNGMPPAAPPEFTFAHDDRGERKANAQSWMCKYCRFYACEKNRANGRAS